MKTATPERPAALARIVQIEPWIDAGELRELERAIQSTFITENDLTREFESMTAQLTGSKHAIAVCNGTVALFVCLKAMGIGPGDEVIIPNLTFIATANAVILAGATPVLCEIREDTFCIDVEWAQKLISGRTRAVMPVHLYGQSADMTAVMDFASRYKLKVIEDAAEGVGVRFNGKHVGTFGDMGILSYYGNKTVTCGEGGVVLTNDERLAAEAYKLKNHGRATKGTFIHESVGFNFAFTDLQAAIGISQMKKMPAIVRKKRDIHDYYVEQLRDLKRFDAAHIDPRCEPVFWFTSFLCDEAEELSAFLRRQNIQSRGFFYPLHQQPCYADRKYIQNIGLNFRVSEKVYQRGISLPSSYSLTMQDQGLVIEQIRYFYAHRD
ncbi:MAG: DegT/DnrJ/EryC1/StrS family aminotransferase [Candidatus Acidiferrales bacterium]|jgi:perosamine synthetase